MISYAQNFEDVILARSFSDRKAGLYIDVGAGDPVEDSVTKHFYDLGWCGINVEPHREKFGHLAAARPRDVSLQLAVSTQTGTATFYERETWGLSSLNAESESLPAGFDKIAKTYQVHTETLAKICAQHVRSRTIDFLKIDAEGAERDVIASMDFENYPATIVLVEATRPNTQIPNHDEWDGMLLGAGYSFVYFDGLNRFYLHKKARKLRRNFVLPPNVFDKFKNQAEVFYHREYKRATTAVTIANEQLASERGAHERNVAQLTRSVEQERADQASLIQTVERERADKASLVQTIEDERADKATLIQIVERERADKASLVQAIEGERADKISLVRTVERERAEQVKAVEQEQAVNAQVMQALEKERAAANTLNRQLEWVNQERAALSDAVNQQRAENNRLTRLIEQEQASNRKLNDRAVQEQFKRHQIEVLSTWNIARIQKWLADARRRGTFVGSTKFRAHQVLHLLTRLWPHYRDALNILARHLGPDGTEAIYARPYVAITAITLREIARSTFWRHVVLPLQDNLSGLFDSKFYLEQNPDVREKGLSPLRHYILFGAGEYRDPHPLFDGIWYLTRYADVTFSGENPLIHFAKFGAAEGRDPHALFDSDWYLERNTDVAKAGINPLAHYVIWGAAEGRDPNPLFDTEWYLAQNPQTVSSGANPLVHYLVQGAAKGRDPSPLFDSDWYLARNTDIAEAGLNPLAHYITRGAAEGRDPNPLFDTKWYLAQNPQIMSSGANPLVHYLVQGAAEGRDPSPLFDSDWYLARNTDIAETGLNPLAHYIMRGATEGRDPNPLFDTKWYLAQNPQIVSSGENPLVHYLVQGAVEGCDPNPLFDSNWYLARNTDVAEAGLNPLVHYIMRGAAEGRDPNPLFDSDWYLAHESHVADVSINPLAHYIVEGAAKGRDPNPFFDTDWYVGQYPEVASSGTNPLAHYLVHGAGKECDPSPRFNTAWYLKQNPDVVTSGLNPLVHYLTKGAAEGRAPTPPIEHVTFHADADTYFINDFSNGRRHYPKTLKPLIICISHVFPWPPRAGNEYRIARILDWLSKKGHDLLVVVVPMSSNEPSEKQRNDVFSKYDNVAICYRDGRVLTSIKSIELSFDAINGRRVGEIFDLIKRSSRRYSEQLHEMEQNWCHESLIGLLVEIDKQVANPVYYINYAFMTRFLEFLPCPARSFVDTIDIFSHKNTKVSSFGIQSGEEMSEDEERRMLERANALVAIHRDDARELRALVPGKPVISAGVDFSFIDIGSSPPRPSILLVAHNNPMNVKGIKDFLRFAWPKIKQEVPGAEFIVVGQVGEVIRARDAQIKIAGTVDSLERYYRNCRVVLNPAVAGTGLKIKTVESIAYFRPIVTWPHGADGIEPPLLQLCNVVHNWYEFAEKTAALLSAEGQLELSSSDRESIKKQLQGDVVYHELGLWLESSLLPSN